MTQTSPVFDVGKLRKRRFELAMNYVALFLTIFATIQKVQAAVPDDDFYVAKKAELKEANLNVQKIQQELSRKEARFRELGMTRKTCLKNHLRPEVAKLCFDIPNLRARALPDAKKAVAEFTARLNMVPAPEERIVELAPSEQGAAQFSDASIKKNKKMKNRLTSSPSADDPGHIPRRDEGVPLITSKNAETSSNESAHEKVIPWVKGQAIEIPVATSQDEESSSQVRMPASVQDH